MSKTEVLKAKKRKVGTRTARKLRAQGLLPASLQAHGEDLHLDFSISEHEFLATRRHHTHVYDIDVEGNKQTAVVEELQWDTFGERLMHIEFKRVRLGEKTESTVALEFFGHPKGGVLNHLVNDITIFSIPSLIPDSIEVKVGDLEPGDSIHAGELELPEGIELAMPADTLIANVVIPRADAEEVVEAVDEAGTAPGQAPAPKPEGEGQ